jgi:hypothetical protein
MHQITSQIENTYRYKMESNSTVDEALFEAFADGAFNAEEEFQQLNYCPDCPDTPMVASFNEYKCPHCYRVISSDANGADIKTLMGANTLGRFRSANEYTKMQKEVIMKQLRENNAATESKFPMDILEEAASHYNCIQKLMEPVYDASGKITGERKFVHRSDIKDQLLSALIYFVCIAHTIYRKKKDIAVFMQLQTNGFSTGETIVRTLCAEKKLTLKIGDEPIEGFANRYLEALNLENDTYLQFIVDLVHAAENKNIGTNSLPSSKVVGAIWILNTQLQLKITSEQLERAGDNTKKNTFIKFCKEVQKNIDMLAFVFKKHKIAIYK